MLLRIHVRGDDLYIPPLVFFGLLTALQPFTRVFAVVSAWAHSPEVCLFGYLGDWLFLASLGREAKQTVQSLSSTSISMSPGGARPLRGSTSTYSKCRLCLDAVCISCNHNWPYRDRAVLLPNGHSVGPLALGHGLFCLLLVGPPFSR